MNVGKQIVRVISALPGGYAEQVLKAIGTTVSREGARVQRSSAPWQDVEGVMCTQIEVSSKNDRGDILRQIVILKLGAQEGLFLKDDPDYCWYGTYSLKEIEPLTLPIGNLSRRTQDRINSIAQSIVSTWVVKGEPFAEKMRQMRTSRKRIRNRYNRSKYGRESHYLFMHSCY